MKELSIKTLLKYTLIFGIMGMIGLGMNSCSPKYGCPSLEGQADLESGKVPESNSGLFDDGKKRKRKKKK